MQDLFLTEETVRLSGVRYKMTYNNEAQSPAAQRIRSHIHDCTELCLTVSGDVSFLARDVIYPIGRGDIVLTRASELHHCIHHSACPHEHFCLWIEEEHAKALLGAVGRSGVNHLTFPQSVREELITLFHTAYHATAAGEKLEATAALLAIFVLLNRGSEQTAREETVPQEFRQVLEYVNKHYGSITGIRQVTERFFVSPSTLHRQFLRYLGIPPKAYLDAVKLSNAKRMLDEGKSVTQVCFACGYCDSSHFIRSFKKRFGLTPHRYRVSQKKIVISPKEE